MAKQKQEPQKVVTKSPLEIKVEQEWRKKQLAITKESSIADVQEQIDRYIELVEQKGYDDPIVMLNGAMLEVIIMMRDLTTQVCEIAEVMLTFDSMLGMMDGALESVMEFFRSSKDYKGRDIRQLKKDIRNFNTSFRNRLKAVRITVKAIGGIAGGTRSALSSLSKGIKFPKLSKKSGGGKGAPAGDCIGGEALRLVNARRSERGTASPAQADSAGADAPTPKAPPSASSGLPGDLPI